MYLFLLQIGQRPTYDSIYQAIGKKSTRNEIIPRRPGVFLLGGVCCTTRVPPKSTCSLSSPSMSNCRFPSISSIGSFICGTDSPRDFRNCYNRAIDSRQVNDISRSFRIPVNMLSSTTQGPRSSSMSHGTRLSCRGLVMETISPGTS